MKRYLITDVSLASRLYRSGIMNYFNDNKVIFLMTDLCYKGYKFNNNEKDFADEMIRKNQLQIVCLNESQMIKVQKLYLNYKPKFLIKTISSIVFAGDNDVLFISEDDLLREIALKDFNIASFDKSWLTTNLIDEIRNENLSINTNILRMII